MRVSEADTHSCGLCVYVANAECIYVDPQKIQKVGTKPIFVGNFTMPGWTGHSPFYIFKCEFCQQISIDYPHGYINFGLLYLRCKETNCRKSLPLEVQENKKIYQAVDSPLPNPSLRKRRKELQEAIAEAVKGGKQVIILEESSGWREALKRLFRRRG